MSDNPLEWCSCCCEFCSNCDCSNLTLFDWIGITACIRCCSNLCDDVARDKKKRQYQVVEDKSSGVKSMRMQRLDF